MRKRIRLEFFDRSGMKHSISVEGDITVEKIRGLLQYVEIMAAGTQGSSPFAEPRETKMERLLDVINTRLADRSFDSREIWQLYRETWSEEFSFGAMSTYLSRLVDRGILDRVGSPSHWTYRLKPSPTLSQ